MRQVFTEYGPETSGLELCHVRVDQVGQRLPNELEVLEENSEEVAQWHLFNNQTLLN